MWLFIPKHCTSLTCAGRQQHQAWNPHFSLVATDAVYKNLYPLWTETHMRCCCVSQAILWTSSYIGMLCIGSPQASWDSHDCTKLCTWIQMCSNSPVQTGRHAEKGIGGHISFQAVAVSTVVFSLRRVGSAAPFSDPAHQTLPAPCLTDVTLQCMEGCWSVMIFFFSPPRVVRMLQCSLPQYMLAAHGIGGQGVNVDVCAKMH